MKKAAVSFLALSAALLAGGLARAAEIPVDRVVLSTSGLAHFELRARVEGDATLEFPVRLEQVDDILKSLVVFDEKGTLGSVTLPGKQPLAQIFRDLPFDREQLSSAMMLLNAYQGAVLEARGVDFSATGKILHVRPEEVRLRDGETVTRHRLALMTQAGIRSAILEDLTSIRFEDEKARAEITRALEAVRENRASGRRMLSVGLKGKGARDVALSYVVDAPLWKAAYRMVVPGTSGGKGLLQGWAVVENMTAGDWKDVDLALVSGNPVTYKQALYESYYVDRPELPVQVFGRVMPRVDTGAVATVGMAEGRAAAVPAPAMKMRGDARGAGEMMMAFSDAAPAPAPQAAGMAAHMGVVAQAARAAQGVEATTQVLFRFPGRFSLGAGQSMMLPFVSREMPMERVSLYQPDTHATHPLAAVALENDGETGLPPGILTLYEESAALGGTSFVGDAQLPVLARGETRMIGYALDSKTQISREDKSATVEDRATISGGVMKSSVVSRLETSYTIKAPAREDRVVVIEHPRRHDYTLVSPDPAEVEVMQAHYRIRVPVKAGETRRQDVVLERQYWQSYGIDSMPLHELQAYATSRGRLDAETRRAFSRLAGARGEIDALDQQVRELDRQKQEIFDDQARVRENLKSLEGKSGVQQKYLEKLEDQEDRIAALDKQRKGLLEERGKMLSRLRKMVAELEL